MVDVIVVYESIFGNTRVIAEAVADGVREADPDARVTVLRSAEATPDKTRRRRTR
jgi:flavorubredoxin